MRAVRGIRYLKEATIRTTNTCDGQYSLQKCSPGELQLLAASLYLIDFLGKENYQHSLFIRNRAKIEPVVDSLTHYGECALRSS